MSGVSFEANKAALINFGWGIPVNAENKKNGQLYFGLTVDSNILKGLGIVKHPIPSPSLPLKGRGLIVKLAEEWY